MFKKYRRKKIAELRPVTHAECRGFHQSTTTKGFFNEAYFNGRRGGGFYFIRR